MSPRSQIKSKAGISDPHMLQVGDCVECQMGLFGIKRSYESRVEVIRPYTYFREVMTGGIFRYCEQDHHFATMNDGTRIRNEIRFSARLGALGRPLEMTLLRASLKKMLADRNARLKKIAESNEWQNYLEVKEIKIDMDTPLEKVAAVESQSRVNMRRFA